MKEAMDGLLLALVLYSIGFGITLEAVARTSRPAGRAISTELEWQLNGIVNLFYFILTAWLFYRLLSVVPWWGAGLMIIGGLLIGTIATAILQRLLGVLRGVLFFFAPINLVLVLYILLAH